MNTVHMNFPELAESELVRVEGGKGWGWIGWLEPAYEAGKGFLNGFSNGWKSGIRH